MNLTRYLALAQTPPGSSTPAPEADSAHQTCIANISPAERRKRLIGGVIPLALALGILAWMLSAHVERLWRLPLFLLFEAAAAGYFQWRDKT
jgi:hypothetical protein